MSFGRNEESVSILRLIPYDGARCATDKPEAFVALSYTAGQAGWEFDFWNRLNIFSLMALSRCPPACLACHIRCWGCYHQESGGRATEEEEEVKVHYINSVCLSGSWSSFCTGNSNDRIQSLSSIMERQQSVNKHHTPVGLSLSMGKCLCSRTLMFRVTEVLMPKPKTKMIPE